MNRVRYRGEWFIVERGSESICENRPAAPTRFSGVDLAALLRSLPLVDEDYLQEVIPAPEFGGSFIHPSDLRAYGVEVTWQY